jgi:hypothetical protein
VLAMCDHDRPGSDARQCLAPPAVMLAPVDESCVETERDVVQKQPLVGASDVDAPLGSIERAQRADRIVAIEPEIACEMVAGPEGNRNERHVASEGDLGDGRERPVTAGHAELVGLGATGELDEILALLHDVCLDPARLGLGGQLLGGRGILARSRVDEEEGAQGTGQPTGTHGPSNEPFGPWCCPGCVPIFTVMSERGLHQIEDDLSETWLEDWAGAGLAEIEALLAKPAAFLSFLDTQEA